MFVLTVTPIKKTFGTEALSYFTSKDVPLGSIIFVPIRSRKVPALVIESVQAETLKASLRSSDFALKKIEKIVSKHFFSPAWMNAVKQTSEYFAATLGETISSLVPAVAMNNLSLLALKKIISPKVLGSPRSNSARLFSKQSSSVLEGLFSAFQGSEEERESHYKGIIRESFAKRKSVFLCLPNDEEIDKAEQIFKKGIEKYTLVWKPKMGKKKFLESWNILLKRKHPALIIGSPQWFFLPISDLGTVILDGEQSSVWKSMFRPFIDFKKFTEIFTNNIGANFILGDNVLSAETIWKYKNSDPYKFESLNFRASFTAQSLIVDMKKSSEEGPEKLLLSDELIKMVEEVKEKGKNMFIYATRKGLSSMTVCRDCGREVLCRNCASPVVLYKRKEDNVFKCHQCGEMRSAEEVCHFCGSWRLLPLGIGVERVVEEISKKFTDLKIFEVNKEATPTLKLAKSTIDNFYSSPGGAVLVGTEMAIGLLNEPVDFAAVSSMESLFSIPDFHIREKIFQIIVKIKSIATDKFLIQVRNAERETVEMALSGNILDFYKREIKEREELGYPPFSVFIKVICRGTRAFVQNEMSKVSKIFKSYHPAIFSSSFEKQGAMHAENAVIKIGWENWVDPALLALLRTLPLHFEVKVDPDNLL